MGLAPDAPAHYAAVSLADLELEAWVKDRLRRDEVHNVVQLLEKRYVIAYFESPPFQKLVARLRHACDRWDARGSMTKEPAAAVPPDPVSAEVLPVGNRFTYEPLWHSLGLPESSLEEYSRIPLTYLDLSVQSRNCLTKADYRTMRDLLEGTRPGLLRIHRLGRKCLEEIVAEVQRVINREPLVGPYSPYRLVDEWTLFAPGTPCPDSLPVGVLSPSPSLLERFDTLRIKHVRALLPLTLDAARERFGDEGLFEILDALPLVAQQVYRSVPAAPSPLLVAKAKFG